MGGCRVIVLVVGAVAGAAAIAMAAIGVLSRVSPRPRTALIRWVMDRGGEAMARSLAAHVPAGVTARLDLSYDPTDPVARFDVFHPGHAGASLPTVVWIHGGAWVSGSKDHVANYLRILAGAGFTTIGIDYATAPAATYPTPLRQVCQALEHIVEHADELHVDPDRLLLAGDSAGAQLAAQVASLVTSPTYATRVDVAPTISAARLRGVILHCGAYDPRGLVRPGPLRRFVEAVLWAYSGTPNQGADDAFAATSVIPHLTTAFPPTFVSSGDADPLTPRSIELAARLAELGVDVETLFFEGADAAGLGHEYQFDLDRPAGRLALERSLTFARRVTAR